jgi:hypothetical protein
MEIYADGEYGTGKILPCLFHRGRTCWNDLLDLLSKPLHHTFRVETFIGSYRRKTMTLMASNQGSDLRSLLDFA